MPAARARRPQRRRTEVIAAVDLGSNSFHMVVARHTGGRLVVIDRLREMVRLAAGLRDDGRLDAESVARALRSLERFGQRLREIHPDRVRVVGTNTLRKAHRKQSFLERARRALGHPVEIISGIEEARLIYLGVSHSLSQDRGRRLVVDIGGGSTELIIGRGFVPQVLDSLYMGCVAMSQQFFPGGRFSRKRLERAQLAAGVELETIERRYQRIGWLRAVGSSGSFKAVFEAIRELDPRATEITRSGLDKLVRRLERAGTVQGARLDAISDERAPVFAGGLAIAVQVFESLRLQSMLVADGALREGILHDLIGRRQRRDVRETTVESMQRRFNVDAAQARRVELTALKLLRQVVAGRDAGGQEATLMLGWAARLHEIGLEISHAQYHRHGAYVIEHSDMQGFSREEQRLLAMLVGSHRRRLHLERLDELIPPWNDRARFLIVALRIASMLRRSRSDRPPPRVKLQLRGRVLSLRFPNGWIGRHPLTAADLQQERLNLRALGFAVRYG
jgi:exopolyphosphatase / guanosine-5'-triphosphate,3'-diphosphate pyrophosphatase